MPSYHTDQLIQQIETAPADNAENLLVLFDALDRIAQSTPHSMEPVEIFTDAFTAFYLKQAKKTASENPDILAAHLLLIAQKAFIDQRSGQEHQSLYHAKAVAQALIQSQCKPAQPKPIRAIKQHWFALVASLFICSIAGWYGWTLHQIKHQPTPISHHALSPANTSIPNPETITASQASEMYQTFEMMRNGTCRYLEAIQIPEEHKAIYMESVMAGKPPSNLKDLAIANAYLEKIQCSYTPMLMKKST